MPEGVSGPANDPVPPPEVVAQQKKPGVSAGMSAG